MGRKTSQEAKKIFREFEKLGELYKVMFFEWYAGPAVKKYRLKKNWKYSLMVFAPYLFERQGRPQDWKTITKDIIHEVGDLNRLDEEEIWKQFKKKRKDLKVIDDVNNEQKIDVKDNEGCNVGLNPLAPTGTKYKNKNMKESKPTALSIVKFVKEDEELKRYNHDVLAYVKDNLQQGKITEMYNKLIEINGVGDKIVSFFLRDMTLLFDEEIDLSHIEPDERAFLQPIDAWVRRCCKHIGRRIKAELPNKGTKRFQKFIVNNCRDEISDTYQINPERVNMGMWLFPHEILGDHYQLWKIMDKQRSGEEVVRSMQQKTESYRHRLKNGFNTLKSMS